LPPMPRPTRLRRLFEPGAGLRSWIFISSAFDLFHGDHVGAPRDQPAELAEIGEVVRLADAAQTERPQGAAVLGLGADAGLDLRDLQTGTVERSHQRTSSGTWGPRSASLYASSRPLGTNSSGDRPRRRATSSGRL